MPTVPRLNRPQVQEQALPNMRVSTQADPNAFAGGPAFDKAMQSAKGLGETIAKIEIDEIDRTNKTMALDYHRKALAAAGSMEELLRSKKGFDAAGAREDVEKAWKPIVEKFKKELPNDNVRAMFEQSEADIWKTLERDITTHTWSELNKAEDTTYKAGIQEFHKRAIMRAGDNHEVGKMRASIRAVTEMQSEKAGFKYNYNDKNKERPFETTEFESMWHEAISPMHRDVVAQRVRNGDIKGAKEYFQLARDNWGEVLPADIKSIESTIEEAENRKVTEAKRAKAEYKQHLAERSDAIYQSYMRKFGGLDGEAARLGIPPDVWIRMSQTERDNVKKLAPPPKMDTKANEAWTDMVANRDSIKNMTRSQFDAKYYLLFDQKHRNDADEIWKAEHDPSKAGKHGLLSDDDLIIESLSDYKVPGFSKGSNPKGREADVFGEVKSYINKQVEQYKGTITYERKKEIIKNATTKVLIDEWGRDPELPAALVKPEQMQSMYIPMKEIPQDAVTKMKGHAKNYGIELSESELQRAAAAWATNNTTLYWEIVQGNSRKKK